MHEFTFTGLWKEMSLMPTNVGLFLLKLNAVTQDSSNAWRIRNPPKILLCAFRSSGCDRIRFEMFVSFM